ncbi:MAG: ParA family protein [Chloroflexales bacterium]
MELLVYSAMHGLQQRLEGLTDVAIIAPSRLDQATRLVAGETPPTAIYLDDTRGGAVTDLWGLIQAAHTANVRVLVNMIGIGQSLLHDAHVLGLEAVSERDPEAVTAWLAQALGVAAETVRGTVPILAVGAAKGGIGKTFVTAVLAEGLRRRGLKLLVWDSDISNPGLVSAFRIPASAPSYLHLIQRGPAHWNPTGIVPFIFQPEHTRPTSGGWGAIDFLIGSHAIARAENDVRLPDWQGLYTGVTQVGGYDLVIIDTPPDYLKRPYATHTLMSGGTVVLPCPPGARERMGVGHMLDHFRDVAPERLNRCALLFMDPEKGVVTKVQTIIPIFGARYPEVRALGTLPRAPKIASMADEHDGYLSMLDLGPTALFTQTAHRVADSLMTQLGLTPSLPLPKLGAWTAFMGRMRGEKVLVPPANTSVGTLAQQP